MGIVAWTAGLEGLAFQLGSVLVGLTGLGIEQSVALENLRVIADLRSIRRDVENDGGFGSSLVHHIDLPDWSSLQRVPGLLTNNGLILLKTEFELTVI